VQVNKHKLHVVLVALNSQLNTFDPFFILQLTSILCRLF